MKHRLRNRAMARKLSCGAAIDVSKCERRNGYYVLERFFEHMDYCDAVRERWIWSIGRRRSDGAIMASLSTDLYEHPEFECLWLR